MAEFTYNPVQLVLPSQSALMNTAIPCPKGLVYHRNESAILLLRSPGGCPCIRFRRYRVTFNGNIAVPTGETVGPIAVALAVNGEPIPTSAAIVTPAAVDEYFNVTSTASIDVPVGCCFNVSVQNVSTGAIPINVQNVNLVVSQETPFAQGGGCNA